MKKPVIVALCCLLALGTATAAFAEEQMRTLEAGMNEHLSKPIDPPLLYGVLEKYIQPKR